ncbi:MAG: hypothetical protein QGF53_13375 [Alphaproteobacteria bacterium]|nr:hypothetical protein [Alphaproteobacteria bacterium]
MLRSIETADGSRCVDIFARGDGSFGFAEFRRDFEEGRWYPVGDHEHGVFRSEAEAVAAATSHVPWLRSDHSR